MHSTAVLQQMPCSSYPSNTQVLTTEVKQIHRVSGIICGLFSVKLYECVTSAHTTRHDVHWSCLIQN